MNAFDIVIVSVLAYGLIRGIFRGLVRELSSIIGVLGGFYAAYTYYPHMSKLLSGWISDSSYLNIISYLVIFAAVMVVVGILAVIIKYLLNIAYLGWLDRVSGALFGVLKGALVICVLFTVLTAFLPKGTPFIKNSTLAPYVATTSEVTAKVLSKDMKIKFIAKMKELKKAWQTR
ncbi:MAG: colicin V production protein [Proteobacteria bacterium]|nr:MAG: colicin V production protein [Pseudomonadota bacterium]PIE67109.1 MAG: colicin V production protein [Deltaproteobacteria bacterium]